MYSECIKGSFIVCLVDMSVCFHRGRCRLEFPSSQFDLKSLVAQYTFLIISLTY